MSAKEKSRCSHVCFAVGDISRYLALEDGSTLRCGPCEVRRQALWLCLHPNCQHVGCGKRASDHSTAHYYANEQHCVQLSLSTWRVWCHACDCEVYPEDNDPSLPVKLPPKPPSWPSPVAWSASQAAPAPSTTSAPVSKRARRDSSPSFNDNSESASGDSGFCSVRSLKIPLWPVGLPSEKKDYLKFEFFETEDWSDDDGDGEVGSPLLLPQLVQCRKQPHRRGLVGFANLGNTCYLNAALQTLCHVQPLVEFFLHCQETVEMALDERAGGPSQGLPPMRSTRPPSCAPFAESSAPFASGEERLGTMEPRLTPAFMRLLQISYVNPSMSHVAPSAILNGIRMVNPTFRGYNQQDSQEFMRCFMDQLHEETKYLVMRDPADFEALPDVDGCSATVGNDGDGFSDDDSADRVETISANARRRTAKERDHGDEKSDVSKSISPEVKRTTPSAQQVEIEVQAAVNGEDEHDEHGYETCDSGLSNSTSSEDSVPEAERAESLPDSIAPKTTSASARKKQRCPSLHLPAVTRSASPGGDSRGGGFLGRNKSSDSLGSNVSTSSRSRTRSRTQRRKRDDQEGRRALNKSYKSIISTVFDGKLMSSVQCLTCGQVSSTLETFQDLSLPIPSGESLQRLRSAGSPSKTHAAGSCSQDLSIVSPGWLAWLWSYLKSWLWGPTVSLHDCLAAFFSADELKGDNMYSCGTCKKLRNGTKLSRVLELPEVMCIHLKRFRHEYLGSSKVSTRVSFPLENIDMGPYLHKNCNSLVTTYRLVGVICHLGNSLGGGHYIAYCASASNKWYEFDDRAIAKVPVETVANVEAYVLLYQKHDVMSFLKRERIIQMLNKSLHEMDLMHFYVSKEWLVKFNTFAEPGPIDNGDFLCPHGGVWPHRADRVNDLCVELPQIVWEELQKTYGGGPGCNRLQLCRVCEEWQTQIRKRQANELDRYQELYEEFMDTDSSIFAMSQSWFRQWQAFVRGRMFDIPGAIDNKHVSKSLTNRQGHRGSFRNEYVQVSENMWKWFHGLYGGGPAVLIREVPQKRPEVTGGEDGDGEDFSEEDGEVDHDTDH